MDLQLTISNPDNPRKIPQTIFIEDISTIVTKYGAPKLLEGFNEIFNKYKLMEMQITKQKESMQQKIPEIRKAIEIVEFLSKDHEADIPIDFLLSDTIWAKAKIAKDVQKVALWLGANVMVEFSFDEAKTLLTRNLQNAEANLKSYEEDLNFLQDQITTCEVNISRVYNQNVKNNEQRQQQ
ncbi:Prefoldin [Pseudocohnilembus persalinus]|uniref:Prefoldin subunit 3 n=1 Tax=Pseudocohnilembus persalinus TaxID=266149 RepID=A0A0V0QD36_PSEPJ|nr:Prefoldin [Pseudocohnilembus persalinus]|eukprot:KRW99972.1 Prefoldin [Pseudocohnilembus persalinus]